MKISLRHLSKKNLVADTSEVRVKTKLLICYIILLLKGKEKLDMTNQQFKISCGIIIAKEQYMSQLLQSEIITEEVYNEVLRKSTNDLCLEV